jgi:phospholipid/cholesterol/gamma-HCH transport system permease protein
MDYPGRRRVVDFLNSLRRIGAVFVGMVLSVGATWILFFRCVPRLSYFIKKWWYFFNPLPEKWFSALYNSSRFKIFPRDVRLRRQIFDQMNKIGVTSIPLVFLTALFTGIVLALQSAYQLMKFSAIRYNADLVALSVTRELGPVLTGMVVAGRVGAAITAELGTMRVTEQIDAIETMGTDPLKYLVVPRFIAAMVMLPILAIYFDFVGILGGYLISVFKLDIPSPLYIRNTFHALVHKDVITGLFKAWVFGIMIAIVGCYHGFNTQGGAEGVGKSTTVSVVTSFISIILADCFFTAFFYFFV